LQCVNAANGRAVWQADVKVYLRRPAGEPPAVCRATLRG
jgi:hypothetical protein